VFSASTIGSLFIGGDDTSSIIAAGAAPADAVDILNGLVLLPGSHINSITVRGILGTGSKILAAGLPSKASVGGTSVATAGDPRFQV